MLSVPVSAKQQCAMWDNTIHVEISAPCDKFTAFILRKYAIWNTVRDKVADTGTVKFQSSNRYRTTCL